ncbi:MAG TPA: hypothetical protein VFS93_03050 [Terrimesophilobacter sp.]|nr:hypothetical protein [Terrimesophilobacter sp.]
MRSFLVEPMQHQGSAQHLRVLAELAALGARLTRIETLLVARDRDAEARFDELRDLLNSLREGPGGPAA